jgi:hypothetical protein
MNRELRNILKANVGKNVRIYFHGVGDDSYGSGVIKEVTNSILTFELRVREGTGLEYDVTTYHDIGEIRSVTFHGYQTRSQRQLRSPARGGRLQLKRDRGGASAATVRKRKR